MLTTCRNQLDMTTVAAEALMVTGVVGMTGAVRDIDAVVPLASFRKICNSSFWNSNTFQFWNISVLCCKLLKGYGIRFIQ